MNQEQIVGLIRQLLQVGSIVAAVLGWTWFDGFAASVLQIVGPLGSVITIAWSMISKTKANLITTVAQMPEVQHVTLVPTKEGVELARPSSTPGNVTTAPR